MNRSKISPNNCRLVGLYIMGMIGAQTIGTPLTGSFEKKQRCGTGNQYRLGKFTSLEPKEPGRKYDGNWTQTSSKVFYKWLMAYRLGHVREKIGTYSKTT